MFLGVSVFGLLMILNFRNSLLTQQLDPSLQHQRYGLVSEDGIILADAIEKGSFQGYNNNNNNNNMDNGSNKGGSANNNNNPAKGTADRSRARARNRNRNKNRLEKGSGNASGARRRRRKGQAAGAENVDSNEIEAYREKMKAANNKKAAGVTNVDARVDEFIRNGEPESELQNMSTRERKLFLGKVAMKKQNSEPN